MGAQIRTPILPYISLIPVFGYFLRGTSIISSETASGGRAGLGLSPNLVCLPEGKMKELDMACLRVGWMIWSMQGSAWGNGEL